MLDLTPIEIRVLGALIEKGRTTPDYYPMTLNALTAACNQSSNRHPVTSHDEDEVEAAVARLRDRELAKSVRTSRSRIMKHRHNIEQALVIDEAASALLAVMMLRGSQTVGELRTRTERYHEFADLDEVETALRKMADDDPPLARRLERRPGQKEARWTQLLSATDAGDDEPVATKVEPVEPGASRDMVSRLDRLEARIDALERRLERVDQAEAPLY